jgi:hypothetical protein
MQDSSTSTEGSKGKQETGKKTQGTRYVWKSDNIKLWNLIGLLEKECNRQLLFGKKDKAQVSVLHNT